MIVAESHRARRIVGRLDRGVDFFEAILSLCQSKNVRAAELRGLGSFSSVEIAEYDQATKKWKPGRTFTAGGCEVLNLIGNVSEHDGKIALHAHVTLMRDRDNGVEVLGGHLVAARVFAFEIVLEAWDDVLLRRSPNPETGLALWSEAIAIEAGPAPEASRPATQPVPAVTWAEVASLSPGMPHAKGASPQPLAPPGPSPKRPSEQDVEHGEVFDPVSPGDIIIHPTFARCEVQRIEGEGEFAQVRLKNGRLVRLSLDILKLVLSGQEAGRRVFRAKLD
ncbi:MAG: DUF296 domain-containing protein [Deltaproteobacteria bacterium]|nr:DUF296 domain-containing protein [Deltaproteobacteria bacterium]